MYSFRNNLLDLASLCLFIPPARKFLRVPI